MVEKIKLMLDALIKDDLSPLEQLALVIGMKKAMLPDNPNQHFYIKDCTNLITFIKEMCKLSFQSQDEDSATIHYYLGLEVANIMCNLADGPNSVTHELLYDADSQEFVTFNNESAAFNHIKTFLMEGTHQQ